MDLKLLLIFSFSFFTLASSQSVSCDYQLSYGVYNCFLTIDNPNGFDDFTEIGGTHMEGKTDDDVLQIEIRSGTSSIIPRIVCDSFKFIDSITMKGNRGIQRYTENTLSGCINLKDIYLQGNPIAEIHPHFLRNNINLNSVILSNLLVASLPEELFSTTTNIISILILYSHFLTDFPVNLFKNTPLLQYLIVDSNALKIWRSEWSQSMPQLNRLSFANNSISEIPRNSINSNSLTDLVIDTNYIEVLDYFMFNDVSEIVQFSFANSPIEAIDFNLIDLATNLKGFYAKGLRCVSTYFYNFDVDREANMAEFEPCFAAFDNRKLGKEHLSFVFLLINFRSYHRIFNIWH